MSTILPSSGLHYGVPYESYAAWDAINFSKLKPIKDTASKCKYGIDHPKALTPAMKLGQALHVSVLEPARFEGMFFICPPCDKRTTEGKAIYASAEKAAAGKLLLRSGETEEALNEVAKNIGMARSIKAFKSANRFIEAPGQNEVALLWKDEATGLMCKAKTDKLITDYKPLDGANVIVEIKSCRDASEWDFAKTIDGMDYDAQGASYCSAVSLLTGKKTIHVFIAVENFAPFDCQVFMLDDTGMQTGLAKYRQMLRRYAECVKTNRWPGYTDKVATICTPPYAHERNYEN